MRSKTIVISALGTPLDVAGNLHREGFARHFQQQLAHNIDGVLVGGSMGAMQMLPANTYVDLIREAASLSNHSVELLIGVGDASYARTLERLRMVDSLKIDGVVVLPPHLMKYSQCELMGYFTRLASESRFPLFLYDLPGLSRNKIEAATVRELAKHPNIAGIKCSDEFNTTEPLLDLQSDSFRVIVAKPTMLTELLNRGVSEHLDGLFALAPGWTAQLKAAHDRGDVPATNRLQAALDRLLDLLVGHDYSAYAAFSWLLNLSGVPGNFAPEPLRSLTEQEQEHLSTQQVVQDWLQSHGSERGHLSRSV